MACAAPATISAPVGPLVSGNSRPLSLTLVPIFPVTIPSNSSGSRKTARSLSLPTSASVAGISSGPPTTVLRVLSVPMEDSNFLRLYLLIKKIGTKVCYEIFHRYFSKHPTTLYQQLLPYKKILKPFLFQNQFDLIYGDPNQGTDSRSFDVTLLLLLIRKTCPHVQKPKKGWNRRPSHNDISEGSNLERLRVERNHLAHSGGGNETLDTPTFNKRWQNAELVLLALGASAKEIAELKSMALDKAQVNLEENLSILHDNLLQHIDVSFTKYSENEQKILALENKITALQTKLQHTSSESLTTKGLSIAEIKRKLQTNYLRSESTIPCLEWDVNNKGFFQLEDIFVQPRMTEWKKSNETASPCTIYEILKKHQTDSLSSCIFSDPGKGKSVLMKKLVVDFARNTDTFSEHLPNISMVFLIKCKELLSYTSLEHYIGDLLIKDATISTDKLMHVIKQESHQCLFLVDGLDEIMHAQGNYTSVDELYNLLEGRSIGNASIIATSRPTGLKNLGQQFQLFQDMYIIGALEVDTIREYIRKYFYEKDESYCNDVFENLTGNEQIQELVSSPLTLSIICNIYDNSEGAVPHSIPNLYHELVRQMIQKFKNSHGFVGERRVSDCLLKSVGYVAFQSLKSGTDYFEHQDVVNYLLTKQKRGRFLLRAKRWFAGLNPTSILQLGFITANATSNPRKLNLRYQFEPKMCQKYIAAEYIVNQLLKHGLKRMNELLFVELEGTAACSNANAPPQMLRTNHELCLFIVDSLGRRGEKGLCKELFNNLFKDFGSL